MERIMETSIRRNQIELKQVAPDGTEARHTIPLVALAAWSELLGLDDPGDVLDAILYVSQNGEPEPDPITGENAWTEVYTALQEREQARAATVYVAQDEGKGADPRSPRLRATFAALTVADTVTTAQAATRAKLGLPEPGLQRRTMSTGAGPLDALKQSLNTELAPTITEAREEFLATLRPPIEY